MNANPAIKVTASSSNLRGVFWRVFAAVFLIVMVIGTAITFILPEMYASTALIKVQQGDEMGAVGPSYYDPSFIRTTFEVIQSELVLSNVISRLNLNVQWGKKYFAGQTLNMDETRQLLMGRISLMPILHSTLLRITVYSDDKYEAAQIANAVAESYRDYCADLDKELRKKQIGVLAATYLEEEKTLQADRAQMPPDKLDQLEATHKLLFQKIENAKVDLRIPYGRVSICDTAEPGKAPFKPNKPVNIFLSAVIGAVLGTLTGTLAVLISSRSRRLQPKPTALTNSNP